MYTDVANVVRTASYTLLMVLFSVVCHQDLTLKPLVALLYVVVCPVICFEGFESL